MEEIKIFIIRNRVLSCIFILALIVILSYYITYDMPELIPGIDKWYSLLTNLCIGFVSSFIFFVLQVYYPTRSAEKKTLLILLPKLERIGNNLRELILVVEKYSPEIKKDVLGSSRKDVYFRYKSYDGESTDARHFNFEQDYTQLINTVQKSTLSLLNSPIIFRCEEKLVEALHQINGSSLYWMLKQATQNERERSAVFYGAYEEYIKLRGSCDRLREYLGEIKPEEIEELNKKEIEFFEKSISTIPEEIKNSPDFISYVRVPLL